MDTPTDFTEELTELYKRVKRFNSDKQNACLQCYRPKDPVLGTLVDMFLLRARDLEKHFNSQSPHNEIVSQAESTSDYGTGNSERLEDFECGQRITDEIVREYLKNNPSSPVRNDERKPTTSGSSSDMVASPPNNPARTVVLGDFEKGLPGENVTVDDHDEAQFPDVIFNPPAVPSKKFVFKKRRPQQATDIENVKHQATDDGI